MVPLFFYINYDIIKKEGDNVRKRIENKQFSEERALYNIIDTDVENVTFAGIEDGESVLKEIRNCNICHCNFSLRYPLWHAEVFNLSHSTLDELTRAPIWYSNNGSITHTTIKGVKPVRECNNININFCTIDTIEFGWKCSNLNIENSIIHGPYLLLDSSNIEINNFTMSGKYSFQYVKNLHINNSTLDTKDAKLMLSNSNPKNVNEEDTFFDDIYSGFNINELQANRMINANANKRGKISELLIINY